MFLVVPTSVSHCIIPRYISLNWWLLMLQCWSDFAPVGKQPECSEVSLTCAYSDSFWKTLCTWSNGSPYVNIHIQYLPTHGYDRTSWSLSSVIFPAFTGHSKWAPTQRLAEIENQLTELEELLGDNCLVTAVHTTTNIRHQIHTVKLHVKLQFTIHMIHVTNRLREHLRRYHRIPLV